MGTSCLRSWGAISLVLLLAACVQRGEFRAFQGEVRAGLNHHDQMIRELQQEKRATEAGREDLRKQIADHLNDFTALQQEMAALRGQVEVLRHKGGAGAGDFRESQARLLGEIERLRERVAQLEGTGAPAAQTSASLQPPPKPVERTADDLYKEARFRFEQGDYGTARASFQNLLRRHPDSNLADNAQFWTGECYFREGNFKQAILEFEKVISQYPKSAKIPSALLKQGMAFEQLGDAESARFLYRKVSQDYADSDQAPIADKRLERLP